MTNSSRGSPKSIKTCIYSLTILRMEEKKAGVQPCHMTFVVAPRALTRARDTVP